MTSKFVNNPKGAHLQKVCIKNVKIIIDDKVKNKKLFEVTNCP